MGERLVESGGGSGSAGARRTSLILAAIERLLTNTVGGRALGKTRLGRIVLRVLRVFLALKSRIVEIDRIGVHPKCRIGLVDHSVGLGQLRVRQLVEHASLAKRPHRGERALSVEHVGKRLARLSRPVERHVHDRLHAARPFAAGLAHHRFGEQLPGRRIELCGRIGHYFANPATNCANALPISVSCVMLACMSSRNRLLS